MSFTATAALRTVRSLIRAPPGSISHLASSISAQPSHFPASLRSLAQELAAKESSKEPAANGISNQEYQQLMNEMVSTGNRLLKLVSERADKMGSEEVYDEQVLDLCTYLLFLLVPMIISVNCNLTHLATNRRRCSGMGL